MMLSDERVAKVAGTVRHRALRWVFAMIFAVLSAALSAAAQPPAAPVFFDRVGDAEQLRDGVVTGLAEDGLGFLWIATTDGLLRYDGYRFRAYRHKRDDAGSPPGNVVRVIMRSRDGRIWIGTEAEGVARYDPKTDRFERFGEAEGIPPMQIRALAEGADGSIWIGSSGGGLQRLDPATRRVDSWRHVPDDAGSLPDDRISALLVDRTGQLWVGTWSGVARRTVDGRFLTTLSTPGDPLGFAGTRVRLIAELSDGSVWIGAQQGQVAMVPAAEVARADGPSPERVRRWIGSGANAVAEPLPGEVWLGHPGGIDVHAADDARRLREIRSVPGETLSLDSAEVRALVVDRAGLLWVGSFGGGVQRADPRPRGLVSRRMWAGLDPPMRQFSVVTVGEAPGNELWLGLAGVGVARIAADLSLAELLVPGAIKDGAFEGDQPSGVTTTADGSLWVGTERGLYRRSPGSDAFTLVAGPDFLVGSAVRRLWPDGDGALWIGTADGLFHVDAAGGAPQPVLDVAGQRVGGSVEALSFSGDGAWVGGSAGLFRLDASARRLSYVAARVDGVQRALDVNGLLVDAQGTLWVDAAGLLRATRVTDTRVDFEGISLRHGEDGVAFGANLLDDAQGRIWSQRAVYDPGTDRLDHLLPADGVRIGTGWFRAYGRFRDGRLAFGGREGLLVVTPPEFRPQSTAPPVVITEIRVDGETVELGPAARELRLLPGQRGFSVEFAALDFSAPSRNRHRFRLEGVDADWIEVGPESRVAAYGNLSPGRYRFVVEGSNRAGEWSPEPRELDIVIEPQWWQQWWFRLLALMGLGAATLLLVRWRTHALRHARERLAREVERRTVELQRISAALRQRTQELEQASTTDPLTGLRNRRYLTQEMASELALMRRRASAGEAPQPRDVVLFLIDIHHFKTVNDRYGHAAGDAVLQQFAERLRRVFRTSDHIVRWGGEEFLVIARETDRRRAAEVAERARAEIADEPFRTAHTSPSITASIGFAPMPWDPAQPSAIDWEGTAALADRALRAVKNGGRNGWLGFVPEAPLPPDADLDWLMRRLPRKLAAGEVRLVGNLDLDRMAHLIAGQGE